MAAIRHQINVAVPIRTVWKALTTEQGLCAWWAERARVDARPGGRVVLFFTRNGEEVEERGLFLELRPTRKIEIAWDSPSTIKGTRLAVQLARDGDETRVAIVHSGGALEDEEARAGLEGAWRERLLTLRERLEGE